MKATSGHLQTIKWLKVGLASTLTIALLDAVSAVNPITESQLPLMGLETRNRTGNVNDTTPNTCSRQGHRPIIGTIGSSAHRYFLSFL